MSPALTALFCLLATTGVLSIRPFYVDETFTTNLMKNLAKESTNMVISPVSMQTPLGMFGFGAEGSTKEQIFQTLGYKTPDKEAELAEKQKHLKSEHADGVCWEFADKIMVSKALLKDDYNKTLIESFTGVEVQSYDFTNPEQTAVDVNSWVSNKTHHVIKQLVEPSSVGPDTQVVVLNADYFKGEWKYGFDKSRTKKDCFYELLLPPKCANTTMMLTKAYFKFGNHPNLNAKVIELPYKNENYSMVIVIPADNDIMKLISKINVDELNDFIEAQTHVMVDVMLPKFEVEFKQEINKTLAKMGMSYLFSNNADLTRMFTDSGIKVDSFIHMAKITVDEDGAIDTAPSGTHGIKRSASNVQIFHANQPFFYMIKKKYAGVLFSGIFSVITSD